VFDRVEWLRNAWMVNFLRRSANGPSPVRLSQVRLHRLHDLIQHRQQHKDTVLPSMSSDIDRLLAKESSMFNTVFDPSLYLQNKLTLASRTEK
jgi:hypothetical protein